MQILQVNFPNFGPFFQAFSKIWTPLQWDPLWKVIKNSPYNWEKKMKKKITGLIFVQPINPMELLPPTKKPNSVNQSITIFLQKKKIVVCCWFGHFQLLFLYTIFVFQFIFFFAFSFSIHCIKNVSFVWKVLSKIEMLYYIDCLSLRHKL